MLMLRMLLFLVSLQLLISCGGGGGSGSDMTGSSGTTELEGKWYGEERDTNVPTVIVMKGDTFTYKSDPQYNTESYSGTFSITAAGKMEMHVENASEPAAAGKTGFCLYSLDNASVNVTLACNAPGNTSYPTAFTATNETRVWDFGKQANTLSAIDLAGTWISECIGDSSTSTGFTDTWQFTTNGSVTRILGVYGDVTCSGTPITVTYIGSYSIGTGVTTKGGYSAYELDAVLDQDTPGSTTGGTGGTTPPSSPINFYTIVYIDDSGLLYLGDSVDFPGGSTSQSTRPDTLLLTIPYAQQ
jgi:hypothetical protein